MLMMRGDGQGRSLITCHQRITAQAHPSFEIIVIRGFWSLVIRGFYLLSSEDFDILSSEDYVYETSTSLLTLHHQSMTNFSADCHHHTNQNGVDDRRRLRKDDCHWMKPDSSQYLVKLWTVSKLLIGLFADFDNGPWYLVLSQQRWYIWSIQELASVVKLMTKTRNHGSLAQYVIR